MAFFALVNKHYELVNALENILVLRFVSENSLLERLLTTVSLEEIVKIDDMLMLKQVKNTHAKINVK